MRIKHKILMTLAVGSLFVTSCDTAPHNPPTPRSETEAPEKTSEWEDGDPHSDY